ncbi:HAD-IA family hydrolase [Alphaproteobacteria bacterium]|nr:HAD-IA family hydrolase [Alphaproteobacteria bacterium]
MKKMKRFKYRTIFWDFDGVIKESYEIKMEAYSELFNQFGSQSQNRILKHHTDNPGVSRYVKIPLYMTWSGVSTADDNIQKYLSLYGSQVQDLVMAAPWVPGVLDFLSYHVGSTRNVVVTATPQDEIELLLDKLKISHFFGAVYGAPRSKEECIENEINKLNLLASECVMIGDTFNDFQAAQHNQVDFIFRKHKSNGHVKLPPSVISICDFI